SRSFPTRRSSDLVAAGATNSGYMPCVLDSHLWVLQWHEGEPGINYLALLVDDFYPVECPVGVQTARCVSPSATDGVPIFCCLRSAGLRSDAANSLCPCLEDQL